MKPDPGDGGPPGGPPGVITTLSESVRETAGSISQRPAGDNACPKDESYDKPPLASIRQPGFRVSSKRSALSKSPAPPGTSTDPMFWTNLEVQAAECLPTKAR